MNIESSANLCEHIENESKKVTRPAQAKRASAEGHLRVMKRGGDPGAGQQIRRLRPAAELGA